jgi:hypothetical protein
MVRVLDQAQVPELGFRRAVFVLAVELFAVP